ncbi:MAG: DUF1176 domain-containing protein [Alphaproteobacteria bacterium]|nr:DUF1176 domain-containing protein [Alphaproteobacteria bacterium]MCB9699218.1 DUF1176 domain-containing protein [Alphaproteobacteria bacterium]
MIAVLSTLAWAGDAPGAVKTFGDWTVGCDNVGRCRALGSTDTGDYVLVLDREPGPNDALLVGAVNQEEDTLPTALRIDGRLVPMTFHRVSGDPDQVASASVALARDLANAGVVELVAGERTLGSAPTKGAAAALRWMDEAQGRAGTTSAILARGEKSELPPVPPTPTVTPVPAPADAKEHPIGQAVGKAAQKKLGCWEAEQEGVRAIRSWPLDGGRTLVLLSCIGGAYDVSDVALVVSADGAWSPAAYDHEPARLDDVSAPIVTNADFTPATATLTSYARGRGPGDCGVSSSWAWDGQRFRLLSRTEMPTCAGSRTWIPTWTCESAP